MTPIPRERLLELREFFGPRTDGARCETDWDTMAAIIDMALRSVSEETLALVAHMRSPGVGLNEGERLSLMNELGLLALSDLREAAEALRGKL